MRGRKMTLKWTVRPILCLSALAIAAFMMLYGLIHMGTADVVPLWFQVVIATSWGWIFYDRSYVKRHGTKELDSMMEANSECNQ